MVTMSGWCHQMSCFAHNPKIFSLASQRRKEIRKYSRPRSWKQRICFDPLSESINCSLSIDIYSNMSFPLCLHNRWKCGSRTGGWSGREWREGSRLRPTTWKTTTLTRPPRPALNERRRSDAERRGLDWTPANAAQCNPSTISLESCRNQTLFFF